MKINFDNEKNMPLIKTKVLHNFDENERIKINLHGEWFKKRVPIEETDFSIERDKLTIEKLQTKFWEMLNSFRIGDCEKKNLPFPENEISDCDKENGVRVENYNGEVWYYKQFSSPVESADSVIKFHSVNYLCDVWLNGVYLDCHEGGFNAFSINTGNILKPCSENNEIVLRIINPSWGSNIETIPAHKGTDYFNYTGVIQGIELELLKNSYIPRVDISLKKIGGQFEIKSYFDSLETNENYSYRTTLYESRFNDDLDNPELFNDEKISTLIGTKVMEIVKDFTPENSNEVKCISESSKGLKLWSIREPNLYVLKTELIKNTEVLDIVYSQYGFRTVEVSKDKIKFNSKVAFFTGIARHEEWIDSGRTATWSKILEDLKIIYDLRATLVRTSHYPNHIFTYRILDRLGLVSMVEVPIWQHEAEHFINRHSQELALNMWRETNLNLFNSPSIILWSTQNESNASIERVAYNELLVNDLRKYRNDYRLVTQSAAADRPGYFDLSMKPLDVAGWTMYFEIFYGKNAIEDTRSFLENANELWGKPILNTEYGVWSSKGEEYQEEMVVKTLNTLLEYASLTPEGEVKEYNGFLCGVDYWTIFDWFCDHNKWVQTMGLYDITRTKPKKIKNIIQSYYSLMTDKNNGLEK